MRERRPTTDRARTREELLEAVDEMLEQTAARRECGERPTSEERIRMGQALRDAGLMSHDSVTHLIAYMTESIVEDRMDAYPWEGRTEDEFNEFNDRLTIAALKELGEWELAHLYEHDREEFYRRERSGWKEMQPSWLAWNEKRCAEARQNDDPTNPDDRR